MRTSLTANAPDLFKCPRHARTRARPSTASRSPAADDVAYVSETRRNPAIGADSSAATGRWQAPLRPRRAACTDVPRRSWNVRKDALAVLVDDLKQPVEFDRLRHGGDDARGDGAFRGNGVGGEDEHRNPRERRVLHLLGPEFPSIH